MRRRWKTCTSIERDLVSRALRSMGERPETPPLPDPRCPKRLAAAEKKMLQNALKRLS